MMTLKQQVIADALTAHPTMPTHTLARQVFRDNFPLWTHTEAVRRYLRCARAGRALQGKFRGQKVAQDLGGPRPTEQTMRARALCAAYPHAPTMALARMLQREHPQPIENARGKIRNARKHTNP